jgi:hypothetical protein
MHKKHYYFWITIVTVLILGPLFLWNPLICESDKEEFVTDAYAEESRGSRMLFASCLCILTASAAPLADTLLDLWRHVSGRTSEVGKSPYTWNIDSTSSAVYLAERLSVILVFDSLAILTLEVTKPDGGYDKVRLFSAPCLHLHSHLHLTSPHVSPHIFTHTHGS